MTGPPGELTSCTTVCDHEALNKANENCPHFTTKTYAAVDIRVPVDIVAGSETVPEAIHNPHSRQIIAFVFTQQTARKVHEIVNFMITPAWAPPRNYALPQNVTVPFFSHDTSGRPDGPQPDAKIG